MLYKMHLCREELAVLDEAMKNHITLMDLDAPTAAAESAARKIALLKDYVDLNAQILEAVQAKDKAKQAYKAYTFKQATPAGAFSMEEPAF